MIKLSTPSKKDINRIIENFSIFLSNNLSILSVKNFVTLFYALIYDKRLIITLIIVILSVFAHLSSPAFYKSEWITQKIKNQLEQEFDINFKFNQKVQYAMFPVPNFTFKNVELFTKGKNLNEFAQIDEFKVFLSYKKFFEKEKMNIQYLKINNSQISLDDAHIENFMKFFDKEINKKKLTILNSKVFFKDKSNETYSILNIKKSESFFNQENNKNELKIDADIFNNKVNINLGNDFNLKNLDFEIFFPKLNKTILNNFNYFSNDKKGEISLTGIGNNHAFIYNYRDEKLKFLSKEFVNNYYTLSGFANFKPFSTEIDFEFKNIDLRKFFSLDNLFYGLLKSGILLNENLNYKIKIKSKNIENHRKLKYLDLNINFDQKELNFNDSSIKFSDILTLKILNSNYVNDNQGESLYWNILIDVHKSDKLYSYFQTQKKFRKKIENITIQFVYNFVESTLMVGDIRVNNNSSDKAESFTQSFNADRKNLSNRVDIKNFFNGFIELF